MSGQEGNQLLVDVPPSYKKLVKLIAHAFYSGECPPKNVPLPGEAPEKPPPPSNAKKAAQADTTGLGVILLSALAERQWVKEDELARDLTLHPKMARRALRYLEQEQLVQREHRKENQRSRKREAALLGVEPPNPDDEEAPVKGLTISYCAIDYPRLMDSVRYRLAMMPKQVKKEVEGGAVVQRFKCTSAYCEKEFTSFEVFNLTRSGDTLLCDICGSPVEAMLGDGVSTATGSNQDRKERVKLMRELQSMLGEQLRPLQEHLSTVDNTRAPDFDTYANWLTRQMIRTKLNGGTTTGRSGGSGGHRQGSQFTIDKYNEDMQVVVDLGLTATAEAAKVASAASAAAPAAAARGPPKVIPPWLRKSGLQGAATSGTDAAEPGPSITGADADAKGAEAASQLAEEQRRAAFMQQLAAQQAALQQQKPNAAKPLPPWLLGKAGAAAAVNGDSTGGHVKHEGPAGGFDAAFAVKQEPGVPVKQEAAAQQPAPGSAAQAAAATSTAAALAAAAPAAAAAVAAALAAEPSLEHDLEWEDVGDPVQALGLPTAEDGEDIEWEDA